MKSATRKKMDLRNTNKKKILIHEIPTRKNFRPTNIQEKTLDSRNTHDKKFQTQKIPTRKNFGPTRKKFGPTKYPREKKLDPRNTYEGTVGRWHSNHETHNSTRSTKFSTFLLHDFPISFCFSLLFFLFYYFYLSFPLSIPLTFSLPPPRISLILSLPLFLFKMSFHGDRSTSFPRK